MKTNIIRQIKIRIDGVNVGIMAMSAASVKRYMNKGFKLFLDAQGQPVLSN